MLGSSRNQGESLDIKTIQGLLDANYKPGLVNWGLERQGVHSQIRYAAVLVPLFRESGHWKILLTRRTDHVQDHKGQVSFPGGSYEPQDDDLETTALRETYEEIGVLPKDIHILGRLNSLYTITGYLIAPFVGVIDWPTVLVPSPEEVSRIFSVPLEWLSDPTHHEERPFRDQDGKVIRDSVIFFQPFDGEILWGVSARIMVTLLQVLRLNNNSGKN